MLDYSPEVLPKICLYKDMTQASRDIIETLITKEEGGWSLTENKNDHDGGFTYAGITSKVLKEYLPDLTLTVLKTQKSTIPLLSQRIVEIYYVEYYLPILHKLPFIPADCVPAVYSCAVNCGPGTAENLWLLARKEYMLPLRKIRFLEAWTDHYLNIVKNDHTQLEFFAGWMHRVLRYAS